MSDQQALWNSEHAARKLAFAAKPSMFAQQVASQIQPGTKVLELGCGMGGDAEFLTERGATVTATDFSDVVIAQNQQRPASTGLQFIVMDIAQPFTFKDATFDVVYAHLSLHYYTTAVTREVFAEIARVLKPGGRLLFACKSVHDPLYGQGTELEPNMFDLGGHIRHFFSLEFSRELLATDFTINGLIEAEDTYAGKTSAFIRCSATRHSS